MFQQIRHSHSKVQRRAIQIIVGDISYDSACRTLELSSSSDSLDVSNNAGLSPKLYVPYKKGTYPNLRQRPMSDIAY